MLTSLYLCLQSGANVNAQDAHGWTALYHAVCDGDGNMVRLLIKAGACKTVAAEDGITVQQYAQDNDLEDMAELLG